MTNIPDDIIDLRNFLAYDPETGSLTWTAKPSPQATRVKVGAEAGCFDGNGYRTLVFRRKQYLGHRVAWAIHFGRWPIEVDHRDLDPGNNRLDNLRECEHVNNCANRLNRIGASGVRGAAWNANAGKWQSQITVGKQTRHLGLYSTPHEAGEAWKAAKHAECGEFARTA